MKLSAEHEQMPALAAGGCQDQIKLWISLQHLQGRACQCSCSCRVAVMSVEIHRCPVTFAVMIPRIEPDRHFVFGAARDGVPRPGDPSVSFHRPCPYKSRDAV